MGETSIIKQLTALVERITRVEEKIDLQMHMMEEVNKTISATAERVAKVESSSKSSHKRLDEIEHRRKENTESARWWIGLGVTAAGVISGIVAQVLGR